MDSLVSFFSQPVVIGFAAVLLVAILLHAIAKRRRTKEWIAASRRTGLTCMDEDGNLKGDRARGKARQADADYVKSFSLRCLRGGYHQFVAIGKLHGLPVLAADYHETRDPESVVTANQRSSRKYPRTVFAARKKRANFPRMLIFRDRFLSDELKWITNDEEVKIDDDPEFSKAFQVFSPDPEEARRLLDSGVRDGMKKVGQERGLHLETERDRLAIHYGKRIPLSGLETEFERLAHVADLLS